VYARAIELTYASVPDATLEVWTDPFSGGTRLATCALASTGGWERWKTITCPLSESGTHEVYLLLSGVGEAGPAVRLAGFRFRPAMTN
jgi:hypothetical protein